MKKDMGRIIPVVVIPRLEETEPTLSALLEDGILCAEITFRTPCAAAAIRLARERFPEMTVGAGTVLEREQCLSALAAGAEFIVSPGLSREVAELCRERGVPYYPGCATPTEILSAMALGLSVVKFFPAELYGGMKGIEALSAPFPGVRFIPTGGVNRENLEEFLSSEKVFAVGGTFFVSDAIRKKKEREGMA